MVTGKVRFEVLVPRLGGYFGLLVKILRMNIEQKKRETKDERMFQHGHDFFCKIFIYRIQRKPRKISASLK